MVPQLLNVCFALEKCLGALVFGLTRLNLVRLTL